MKDFKLFDYIIGRILNLDDAELGMATISNIAHRLNMSRSLIYDSFKDKGHKPAEFLNREKLSRAIALIGKKEISVKEVSQKMGFHSPDYFIRLFKKYFGTTPGKYKKCITR